MRKLILAFRSTLFYLVYIVTMIIWACICMVFGPFFPLQARFKFMTQWNIFLHWWIRFSLGIKVRIRGKDNIPDEAYVLISNHQSPCETLLFYLYFRPVTAILKQELLNIPFFGWGLRLLKPIPIDRSNPRKARQKVLDAGANRLNDLNISVLIFPEGTRVKPGEERKFSAGGAELAIAAGVKILPVAQNAGHFWPGKKFLKYPGTLDVVVGPPIDSQGKKPKELMSEVEQAVRQQLASIS